jgi:hypothetical protein
MNTEISRFGYKNTASSAGKPENFKVMTDDIVSVNCWFNSYANPSYCLHLADDSTIFCVDDYGCMNNINHLNRTVVKRKKDLFRR